MPETVRLKKYANRRLYDMDQSTYVTLEHVAEMVKEGKQIEVTEAQSKEDVTAFILTQILMEESRKNALLPVSLLHIIIRYGDNFLREFFDKYLEETLNIFIHSKIAYDQYFRNWLQMGMNFSASDQDMQKLQMPFLDAMQRWSSADASEPETTTDTQSHSWMSSQNTDS